MSATAIDNGAASHTPRPWVHYDDTTPAGKTGRHEVVALGRTVAHIYYKDAQGKADARLIAAAPELLEALKALLFAFEEMTKPMQFGVAENAREAIANATNAT